MNSWDKHFIELAMFKAQKSKDPSTKVGAVIVGPDNEERSLGFNGFARGIREMIGTHTGEDGNGSPVVEPTLDMSRWERPQKYLWVEHAERNAIYNAARVGAPLKGCRMYLNWEPTPCADCAKGIIQSGIIEVIGPDIPFGGQRKKWDEHFDISRQMFAEAGILVRVIPWATS